MLFLLTAAPVRAQGPHAFQVRCAVCHQATGAGVPGIYPSIAGTIGNYVKLPQGRTYLVHVLLYGMSGEIESQGTTYVGLMPSAADFSDQQLSDAINYVLRKLNTTQTPPDFKPISPADFKAARGMSLSPTDVLHEREKLIAALAGTNGADHGGK